MPLETPPQDTNQQPNNEKNKLHTIEDYTFNIEPNRIVYGFYNDIPCVGLIGIAVPAGALEPEEKEEESEPILSLETFDFSYYRYQDVKRFVTFERKLGKVMLPFKYIKNFIDIKGTTLGETNFWLIASPYKISDKHLYKFQGEGISSISIPVEMYAQVLKKFKKHVKDESTVNDFIIAGKKETEPTPPISEPETEKTEETTPPKEESEK